ncbi:MAG: phosphotransferase [Anaerolineae bacterium]|nr:phosphotransferase [Anaerolineae bacterium]
MRGTLLGRGRTAEIYVWNDQALKLFVDGFPVEWIQAEAEATRVAHRAGLSAPAVGEIVEVDGRTGIVYERVDGVSMLQTFATRPWTFPSAVRRFVELQVAMHNCARPELPSQRERLKGAIRGAPRLMAEMKEQVLQALDRLPDGDTVCHGDYHPDNIIMSPQGPVVIDWVNATRGNPLADVARTSLMCRVGAAPLGASRSVRWATRLGQSAFHTLYLREYFGRRPFNREQLEAWIPVVAAARLAERIPEEEGRLIALVEAS